MQQLLAHPFPVLMFAAIGLLTIEYIFIEGAVTMALVMTKVGLVDPPADHR